jgi:hypothetical protein
MRRALGVVLIGIGLFGIVLTVLLPTVVVAKSKKTPLDLNITQISSGPATILDPTTQLPKDVQLRATRIVKTDTAASDGTNTTVFETLCIVIVVGDTPNCVTKDDPRLLSATTDRVTADRKSAESVNIPKYNEQINGSSTFNGEPVKHVGMSYKWPIDAKKQTYQFFEPDLNEAFPAVYQGTDKVAGLTVYKYVCETGTQPYKVGGLFDGTYTDTRTVWVEPRTGAIIDGVEHQVQRITDANDPTGPGVLALDTTLRFEQSAIDYQSNYAKDKIDQLRLAQVWGPLITGIIGVGSLVGAFFVLRSRRSAGGEGGGEDRPGEPTPDDNPSYADPPMWAGSSQT